MSFMDSIRQASWRGFDFSIVSDDKSFGRDVKQHKLLNGKKPQYEDIGEKEDRYNVEAIIGGQYDFVEQADEFEALLAQKGTGRLILPHTEELNAVVIDARRRHVSNEVGIVRFSIVFETVDEETKSPSGISSSQTLLTSTNLVNSAASDDFEELYTDGLPDFITAQVIDQLDTFTGDLNGLLNRTNAVLNIPDLNASNASELGFQILSMLDELVVYEPVIDYSIAFQSSSTSVVDSISLVRALFEQSQSPLSSGSYASLRKSNLSSVDLFTRIAAINAAAKASLSADYDSQSQALDIKKSLTTSIRNLRDEAGEQKFTNSYRALSSLMGAVNRDIDDKLGRLPRTARIKLQAVRSSLSLSHRIYGDNADQVVSYTNDLISRNGIIHPSFISAEELEVLSDA